MGKKRGKGKKGVEMKRSGSTIRDLTSQRWTKEVKEEQTEDGTDGIKNNRRWIIKGSDR